MPGLLEQLQQALADRYRIERELGAGGMATVYLAEDLRHHRKVAIKVLRPELATALGPERFLREIEIAAQLHHPNILPLYDSGESQGFLYYVMPYVEGESLRDRLTRDRQLPVADAVQIARQVANALSYAHGHGIVHRDIKPENILLDGADASVADFGIARAITEAGEERLTSSGFVLGTSAYMSPEQGAGERQVDGRSDVYSLGCVLYEMLAGQPPYTGATTQAIQARRMSDPVPSLRTVRAATPAHLETVIARALERVPADRYQTASQFAGALGAGTPTQTLWPSTQPTRRLLIGIGVVVVAAVLAWAGWRALRRVAPSIAFTSSVMPSPNSVAVLHFENLSRDTADVYLAEGLTEDVTAKLGQVVRLAVASRAAVRRLREAAATPTAQLGRALNVVYLVSGSVQRSGTRLRLTAELVRAATGDRVWGDQYDRPAADLLTIQSEIATSVASGIAGRLLPAERATLARRPTRDPAAYDHYLRGNHILREINQLRVPQAIAEYEAALRIDPSFTAARARIGVAYVWAINWNLATPEIAPETLMARAVAASDQALLEDSLSSDAWMARGALAQFRSPQTFGVASEALRRAIALDPENSDAHRWLGGVLRRLGDFTGGEAELHRSLELDPSQGMSLADLGFMALQRRRYAEASRWYDSAVTLEPTSWNNRVWRARVRIELGDSAGALRDVRDAVRLSAANARRLAEAVLSQIEAQTGNSTSARARLEALLAPFARADTVDVRDGYELALALVATGQQNRALDLLERVRPRGPWLWSYLLSPGFDPIRSQPRFQRVYQDSRPAGAERGPRVDQ